MSARKKYGKFGPIIGAIDEGAGSARFLAFAASTSEVLTFHHMDLEFYSPREGWIEQDPMIILKTVEECLEKTTDNMIKLDIDPRDMVAIGIANQRETTVLWDKLTGKPLHNAILWFDTRTSVTVDDILSKVRHKNADILRPLCGLPIYPYFSALKIKWLMDNVLEVRQAIEEQRCLFGTIDTWLIWNLTGGPHGGIHVTDVTNASRTMLMNLVTLSWDPILCDFFCIPRDILPSIFSSSEIYGYIASGPLQGVPISGCIGDQQSSLVGQLCLNQGQAKNTYGSGCFLLYNTGKLLVESQHGLLTTVAYQFGRNAAPIYALEGSIVGAGTAVKWLRDNLTAFTHVQETESMVQSCEQSGEVCFVPAFSGLYAPYWRKNARGIICGVVEGTTKAHLVKATMEAVCFQTRDILECIRKDCGIPLQRLLVDGGMTVNGYLMQLQADLCGIPVVRATISETTALGAAIVAGMADGVKVWDIVNSPKVISDSFFPTISQDERDIRYSRWKSAVDLCIEWPEAEPEDESSLKQRRLNAVAAPAIFLMLAFATLMLSKHFAK